MYENSVLKKTTDYNGEFIYEDDTLRLIQHEEGRIVSHPELVSGSYEYQYHLKDHLGNVRMTFSENESTTSTDYLATMEDEPLAIKDLEEMTFSNLSDANRYPDNALWDHTFDGTGAGNSIQLKAIDQFIIGPAKSFYVTANDTVFMEVYAKYEDNSDNGNQNTQVVGNILDNITAAFGISSSSTGEALDAYNAFDGLFSTGPIWGTGDIDDNFPRAYINYLFFDLNYQPVSKGFLQVTGGYETGETGDGVPHQLLQLSTGQFGQDGYLYVYLSMEQLRKDFDVYFDDFKVTHSKTSRVVQSDDYYPFGLTMNSYQRTGSRGNDFLYNGFEKQDELDLGLYDYQTRYYNPELGRFINVDPAADLMRRFSPYSYAFDNPIRFTDPDGMMPGDPNLSKNPFIRAFNSAKVQKFKNKAIENKKRIITPIFEPGLSAGGGFGRIVLGPVDASISITGLGVAVNRNDNNEINGVKGEIGTVGVNISVGDTKFEGSIEGLVATVENTEKGVTGDIDVADKNSEFEEGTNGLNLTSKDLRFGGAVGLAGGTIGGIIDIDAAIETGRNTFLMLIQIGIETINELQNENDEDDEN